jgi:hypothetical protein
MAFASSCTVAQLLSLTYSLNHCHYYFITLLLLLLLLLFSHRPSVASIPGRSSWCRSRIRPTKATIFHPLRIMPSLTPSTASVHHWGQVTIYASLAHKADLFLGRSENVLLHHQSVFPFTTGISWGTEGTSFLLTLNFCIVSRRTCLLKLRYDIWYVTWHDIIW